MLRAADLFLLTTEPPESFGIVLIEAMACGLPAIATDYPGVRAVVDDGETGPARRRAATPARSPRRSTGWPTTRPERRARMGAAGRAKAEREWSWPRLLDRMDDAYARGDRGAAREGGADERRAGSCSSPTSTRRAATPARSRPAAMAKWLRRLGHEVTVLTTSAYGERPTTRPRTSSAPRDAAALARAARRPGLASTRCSTPTPTRAGRTRSSKVLVPEPLVAAWAPFARSRGAAPAPRERASTA